MHSLEIVQWNSTRRDHPGNPGGVSGSGPVTTRIEPYGVVARDGAFFFSIPDLFSLFI